MGIKSHIKKKAHSRLTYRYGPQVSSSILNIPYLNPSMSNLKCRVGGGGFSETDSSGGEGKCPPEAKKPRPLLVSQIRQAQSSLSLCTATPSVSQSTANPPLATHPMCQPSNPNGKSKIPLTPCDTLALGHIASIKAKGSAVAESEYSISLYETCLLGFCRL